MRGSAPMMFDFETEPQRAPSHSCPAPCSAFRVIVADPPWEYDDGFRGSSHSGNWHGEITSKPLPYPSMTVKEICALKVSELADKDCRLWLWTTNKYLPDAFRVIEAWGFRYRQTLVWHKADPAPLTRSVTSNGAEFLLVAVRGNPPCKKRLPSAVIKLPMTKKHSKKPVEWQWLIEQTDDGPRLELFARRKRPGWHVWGNEIANDVEMPNDRTQRRLATEQPHQPEAAPRRPLE